MKRDIKNTELKILNIANPDNVYGLMFENLYLNSNRNFHTHKNYHEFLFMFKGKLGNEVNGKRHVIEEMQIAFIREQDTHRHFSLDNKGSEFYNVGIPLCLFEKALGYLNADFTPFTESEFPTVISVHKNDFGSIKHKINLFHNSEYGPQRGMHFMSLLTDVIYLFCTANIKYDLFTFAPDTPEWVYKLVDVLRINDNFLKGLPKLIEISGYSQSYLNRSLRRYLGISPTKMLNILKLDYARKLIDSGKLRVIDACYKSGFNNESYFYKEFKKQYGVTPGKLIENLRLV